MFSFSKTEWRFLGIVWVIVIILTFFPMIFGYLTTPVDKIFLFRPNVNGGDFTVYYSYIEQVKNGDFLSKNLFTSEEQPVGIFRPFWVFVGILAKIFNLPSFLIFQICRFLFIPFLLLTSYYVISSFLKEESKRRICFLLFVFASGWGWIIGLDLIAKNNWRVIDLFVPEAFTFTTLYTEPHFIVSLSLIILIFLFSIKAFSNYKLKYSLLAGLFSFTLFSFHPYHMYSIFGVLFTFIVVDSLINKKIYLDHIKHFLILAIFSFLPILYHLWTILNIPVAYEHYLQNVTLTPPFYLVFISYGFLIPLALIGIVLIIKNKKISKNELFLIVWFFVQFALLYLPIKTQVRLTEGLQLPIAILATLGIFYTKSYLPKHITYLRIFQRDALSRVAFYICFIYAFFILFFISSANLLYTDFILYSMKDEWFYIPKSEYEAIVWLKSVPKDSIILSGWISGNYIPAFSIKQVFIGHSHETGNFDKKAIEVNGFLKDYSSQERSSFLKDSKIDYFFFGPKEKKEANFNPDQDSFLQKVYQNGEVSIYKVVTP